MAIEISLTMRSEGDAFAEGRAPAEIARILRDLADAIADGAEGAVHLVDVNGNGCGRAMIEIWTGEE